MVRINWKEPQPWSTAIEDRLAACPTEQSRGSVLQAILIGVAGRYRDQAGVAKAALVLRQIATSLEVLGTCNGRHRP